MLCECKTQRCNMEAEGMALPGRHGPVLPVCVLMAAVLVVAQQQSPTEILVVPEKRLQRSAGGIARCQMPGLPRSICAHPCAVCR